MHYLIQNGPKSFRHHLRKKDGCIKMATSYQETPNPLTGTSTVEAVHKQSQELLQLLFDAQLMAGDEAPQPEQLAVLNKPLLGGLGSSGVATGKYEGFGNSPVHKEGTFTEKMLNAFERWASSPDQTDILIQEALSSSPGQYEPVTVDDQIPSHSPKPIAQSYKAPIKTRVHIPGKAGGGWDDVPSVSSGFLEEESVLSADSSEQGAVTIENTFPEADMSTEINICPEILLVQDFCAAGPLPCSLTDIRSTGQRCIQLNVKEAVQAIAQILETHLPDGDAKRSHEAGGPEVQLTRAMLLLEWLLRTDVVHPPTVAEICCPPLSRIVSLHTHTSQCKPLPLQAKAEKLLLILQKLQALPL